MCALANLLAPTPLTPFIKCAASDRINDPTAPMLTTLFSLID